MPPLFLGTLLFAGLLLLSLALGRRLLRWLGITIHDPATHAVFAAGLGLGALQLLPFALFTLGAGRPAVFRAATAILAALLLLDLLTVLRAAWRWLRKRRQLLWWEWFLGLLFALLFAVVFLRALCPITDDDGLSYHLTAAVRYLDAGRFVYLPTLTYTNWPLCIESLIALVLGLHPAAPPGLAQFLCGVLTIAAVYLFARRMSGRIAGATVVTLLLVYKVFWEEMTQAHVDLGVMLFATLAVFALDFACNDDRRLQWLRLTALFAGLTATCKLNGAWAIVAVAIVHYAGRRRRDGVADPAISLREVLNLVGIAVCVVLPWLIKSWVLTGNSVYPLFYSVFDGREWTAEGWPRVQRYFFLMNTLPGLPPTGPYLLLARGTLIGAALLVSIVVFARTRRSRIAIPARFAAVLMTCILLGSGYNLRFLLPVFPSAVLGFSALFTGKERILAPVVCLLALVLAIRIGGRGLEPDLRTAASVALGRTSREAYLRSRLPDYAMVEYANRTLAPDSRILVATWEESTAYYRPPALRANFWLQDSVHYNSMERLKADLARLSVTHLALKPMETDWCVKSYVCDGRMKTETRMLSTLAAERSRKVFEANGYTLYALAGLRQ